MCFGVITPSAEWKVEGRIELGEMERRELQEREEETALPMAGDSLAPEAAPPGGQPGVQEQMCLSTLASPSLQTGDAAPWVSACVSLAGQA